ncbi:MAG: tetratricopeptide repeat-containing sensor histidine kinase [Bacteroidota bacterium]
MLVTMAMLFFFGNAHSQKKLTDSLIQKRSYLESRPGFIATDTSYIKVLYNLGRSYIYQIPDSTKNISERVLQLSEQAKFDKGIAGGKMGLGLFYILKGEFDKGFQHTDDASQLAESLHADTILLKCFNAKAMGQFMKGNYPQAYLECKAGENFAKKVGNLEMQVFFKMNLATCFAILKDHKRALPYYQEALQIVNQTNDEPQKAQIESNMGYMYLYMGDYQKAKYYCEKAIEVLNREKYQAWESFAWSVLGEVAIREGNYDMALDYFSKSEALLVSLEDMQRKVETYQGIANAHYWKGDIEKSLDYAKMAESISKDINYHGGIVKSSELLHKLYIAKDKPKRALEYLSVARHLSDSILESENKTKFLMLETQAQFNREKELTKFESEKKLAKQKTITYISVILLIALLTIILLIRKNAINQKKVNLSLKELNNTKDKLFSIIGHDLRAPISTLQELLELYTSKEISEKEIAQLAPKLKQNVDHSSFTLNNLLFWAKTQMNGLTIEAKPIRIKEHAHTVCAMYGAGIKSKEIHIQCDIDREATLMIDPTHFMIILQNVISNAIKYTNKGGTILFNCKKYRSDRIQISICDSGIGMDPSTINTIMDNQTVKSSVGTMNEKGTGIGLQIVRKLVKINNGYMEMKSKPNGGTCVFLNFQRT